MLICRCSVGTDIRDTAIIPDFPRAAQLAAAIVAERWDVEVDGVVAVDPVALGRVLGAVGSVDIGDGLRINQFTAASTLLNGIYLKYAGDNEAQDAAFEHAARRSFDALVSGICIVADPGADTGDLVGRDADSDATAA